MPFFFKLTFSVFLPNLNLSPSGLIISPFLMTEIIKTHIILKNAVSVGRFLSSF